MDFFVGRSVTEHYHPDSNGSQEENPANSQLLGGGRRAGTLRSRVRALQKFLSWLALAHNLTFFVHWRQLVEYMQVLLSEPRACVAP